MHRAIQATVVVGIAAVVGIGAGWYAARQRTGSEVVPEKIAMVGNGSPSQPSQSMDYERRLTRLGAELAQERDEREALAAEVGRLRSALARIEQPESSRSAFTRADSDGDGPHAAAAGPRSMDPGVLVEAGFPREMVYEVKAKLDQMELDRLYLRDLATREGWAKTQRFREEFEALRFDTEANREEYGEEFYDWMLYSTGRPNRVQIDSIMGGSAAEDMGLRAGDQVLRYGGSRVFTTTDLTSGTMAGEPGEATAIEVLRDGRVVRVDVPRGPLGVRVGMTTVAPQPPR